MQVHVHFHSDRPCIIFFMMVNFGQVVSKSWRKAILYLKIDLVFRGGVSLCFIPGQSGVFEEDTVAGLPLGPLDHTSLWKESKYMCITVSRSSSRTVIDMTSIDRSKKKFQLIKKNIMSIIMSINRNTFFILLHHFLPFLANTKKNFEEKLKYSIK